MDQIKSRKYAVLLVLIHSDHCMYQIQSLSVVTTSILTALQQTARRHWNAHYRALVSRMPQHVDNKATGNNSTL